MENYDLNNYKMLWEVVDTIQWPTNYNNCKSIRNALFSELSKEQAGQLRTEEAEVFGLLHDVVSYDDRYQSLYGGDDSFSDMIDEIISYGKDFVQAALDYNPMVAETLKKNGVHETFSCALPYEFDYIEENKKDIQVLAKEEIEEIKSKLHDLEDMDFLSEDYRHEVKKEALKIVPYLKAVENNDASFFNKNTKDLKTYFDNFNKKAKYANAALAMNENTNSKYSTTDILSYLPINLINDFNEKQEVSDLKFDLSAFDEKYRKRFEKAKQDKTSEHKPKL